MMILQQKFNEWHLLIHEEKFDKKENIFHYNNNNRQ